MLARKSAYVHDENKATKAAGLTDRENQSEIDAAQNGIFRYKVKPAMANVSVYKLGANSMHTYILIILCALRKQLNVQIK